MKKNDYIYPYSKLMLDTANGIIPGLTQTFSKGPQVYGFSNDVPHYIQKSSGVYAFDVDHNCYIDYSMGLGSVILGHGYPQIVDAVYKNICNGNSHSLMHPLEIEVGEKVLRLCKWADMVRFAKNGSDVITAAVRLARAYTKRKYIAIATNYDSNTKPYHGWHDWSASIDSMNDGIPEEIKKLTITFEFNNANSLQHLVELYHDKIACIVMEGAKFSPPSEEFVKKVNDVCSDHNICLIMDETINGLRIAPCGAHEKYSYKPDLVTYGKAFGNGFPLSILVGRKKVMSLLDNILFTLTYGGETSSLAAANELLDIYQNEHVYERIGQQGHLLKKGLKNLLEELELDKEFLISGWDCRFRLFPIQKASRCYDATKASLLRKILFKHGILCAGVHNMALLHTDEVVNRTIIGYKNALTEISIKK